VTESVLLEPCFAHVIHSCECKWVDFLTDGSMTGNAEVEHVMPLHFRSGRGLILPPSASGGIEL